MNTPIGVQVITTDGAMSAMADGRDWLEYLDHHDLSILIENEWRSEEAPYYISDYSMPVSLILDYVSDLRKEEDFDKFPVTMFAQYNTVHAWKWLRNEVPESYRYDFITEKGDRAYVVANNINDSQNTGLGVWKFSDLFCWVLKQRDREIPFDLNWQKQLEAFAETEESTTLVLSFRTHTYQEWEEDNAEFSLDYSVRNPILLDSVEAMQEVANRWKKETF